MNRKECERVIFNKMLEMVEVLKKYNPDAAGLSLTFIDEHECDEDGTIIPPYIAFNTYSDEDEEKTIDFSAFNNPPWLEKSGWSLNFTESGGIYGF